MQSISFKLHTVLSPEAPGLHSVWVSAKVGGVELGGSGAPVDFCSVLSLEGLSADFTLLTCSCGVAGCAGFLQDPVQVWGDEEVVWQLNAQEYGKYFPHLAAELADDAPIVLRFPTPSMQTALARLKTAVNKLLGEAPTVFTPGSENAVTLAEFTRWLVQGREWKMASMRRIAREKDAFGPWYDAKLEAMLPTGQSLPVRVYWVLTLLLQSEADAAGCADREASEAYLALQMKEVWRPLLASGLEPLIARMKTASWENEASQWFIISRSRMSTAGTALTEAELWAGAVLRPVAVG